MNFLYLFYKFCIGLLASSEGSHWSTSNVTCPLLKNTLKTSLFPEDKLSRALHNSPLIMQFHTLKKHTRDQCY